jgi:hypothetical protein
MRIPHILRACTRGPWLAALALEGRARAATAGAACAERAAWIAGNALAACGSWVRAGVDAAASAAGARTLLLDCRDPRALLAAIAVLPAIPVAPTLSLASQALLRVLGIPVVDAMGLAAGARTVEGTAPGSRRSAAAQAGVARVHVRPVATGFVVEVDAPRALAS